MRPLSKSKLLAFRQCPKRLWLEVHQPELRADSGPTLASFATGHQVGDIARQLYDPQAQGTLIDPLAEGFDAAFARTQRLPHQNARRPRCLITPVALKNSCVAMGGLMRE